MLGTEHSLVIGNQRSVQLAGRLPGCRPPRSSGGGFPSGQGTLVVRPEYPLDVFDDRSGQLSGLRYVAGLPSSLGPDWQQFNRAEHCYRAAFVVR